MGIVGSRESGVWESIEVVAECRVRYESWSRSEHSLQLRLPTPVRQLQPTPPVATRLLDLAKGARDIGRDGTAPAPDLQPADGRLAGRKDNAGIQDSEGSKAVLHPAEEGDDLVAVDPLEQCRPGAGRRRARPTACRPARTTPSVTSSSSSATPSPSPPGRARQQVHVDVAVAGVAEHHDRRSRVRADAWRTARMILAHPLDGHAAVLDHLKRATLLRQAREDRARGVADAPEPLGRLSA